eukprot:c36563_g1_i1 orf=211-1005(+)
MAMARQHLALCALLALGFLLPLAAARPGGRSCHTSFFFPNLDNNHHLRTLTLIREGDGAGDGVSAGFKVLSIAKLGGVDGNGWIHSPSNLIQVRLHNLHRQKLFNPSLPHSLDLPQTMERPFDAQPAHRQIVHTWSFSTSNPQHPITWIDVHSRRGLWRHDLTDQVEQTPLHIDDEAWRSTVNELWRTAFGLLFGAACGMVVAVTMVLTWTVLHRLCMRSREDEDVGFLYGYQELPSPRSSEKEDVKDILKGFTKDNGGKVENM